MILHKRTRGRWYKTYVYGRVPLILCVCFIVCVVRLLYLRRYYLSVFNYHRYMGVHRTEAGVGAPPPPPPRKNTIREGLFSSHGSLFHVGGDYGGAFFSVWGLFFLFMGVHFFLTGAVFSIWGSFFGYSPPFTKISACAHTWISNLLSKVISSGSQILDRSNATVCPINNNTNMDTIAFILQAEMKEKYIMLTYNTCSTSLILNSIFDPIPPPPPLTPTPSPLSLPLPHPYISTSVHLCICTSVHLYEGLSVRT